LEKFSTVQMIDVFVRPPTGARSTSPAIQPEPELKLLIEKLKAHVARSTAAENQPHSSRSHHAAVVQTFGGPILFNQVLGPLAPLESAKTG